MQGGRRFLFLLSDGYVPPSLSHCKLWCAFFPFFFQCNPPPLFFFSPERVGVSFFPSVPKRYFSKFAIQREYFPPFLPVQAFLFPPCHDDEPKQSHFRDRIPYPSKAPLFFFLRPFFRTLRGAGLWPGAEIFPLFFLSQEKLLGQFFFLRLPFQGRSLFAPSLLPLSVAIGFHTPPFVANEGPLSPFFLLAIL